jgi:hydrogenase-4 component F
MTLILLLLIPLVAGLLCLTTRSSTSWERLNLLAFALLVPLALKLGADVLNHETVSALDGFLRADALSVLVAGLTVFVALVCSVYSVGYFRAEVRAGRISEAQLRRYYVLTPLFVAAMLLVPLADNLGVMWVAIESATLASVLLVTFFNQKTSFEAGWKYIIIGSVGISLALFGTIITYYSAVSVPGADVHQGMNWSALVQVAEKFDPRAMRLAFVFAMLGYGTKAGLAPMHTWKPDAYSEAPVPAATLLGAGFVNCAIYGIMRFDVLAEKSLGHEFPGKVLAGFGVASILVAVPFILTQRDFRRILAYSSIAWFRRPARRARCHSAHVLSRRDQAAHVFLRRQRPATVLDAVLPQSHRRRAHAAVDGRIVSRRDAGRDRPAALQHFPERIHHAERGVGGRPDDARISFRRGSGGDFRGPAGSHDENESRHAAP